MFRKYILDNILILGGLPILIVLFGIAYANAQMQHELISFTQQDRFEMSVENDINVSIPNGYSMRSGHVAYFGLLKPSVDVGGWYYAKGSCTDGVEMPRLGENGIDSFLPYFAFEIPVEEGYHDLGICIEKTKEGNVRAYADNSTRNAISKEKTIDLIKAALYQKDRIEWFRKKQAADEKERVNSWRSDN